MYNNLLNPAIKPKQTSTTHELKTWPVYFRAVERGDKTFEYRKNDRDFKVGDTDVLREWDEGAKCYTGAELSFVISYVLKDIMNVPEGYAILGFKAKYITRKYDSNRVIEKHEGCNNEY
jgi:hypothetical protein